MKNETEEGRRVGSEGVLVKETPSQALDEDNDGLLWKGRRGRGRWGHMQDVKDECGPDKEEYRGGGGRLKRLTNRSADR